MPTTSLDGVGSLQEQVRRIISAEITGGDYAAGAQLPTEREYAERLGVSLITIRGALTSLVNAGYIERSSGRGTFLSAHKVPYQIRLMTSTSASLQAAGVPFEIRLISAEVTAPPLEVQRTLRLPNRTAAFRLRRVVSIRETPCILLDSWLRRSLSRDVENDPALAAGSSLYSLLAQRGIVLSQAEGRLELGYANDDEAQYLRLPFGAPLFAYQAIALNGDNKVIESARALYDANRFSLTIAPEISHK